MREPTFSNREAARLKAAALQRLQKRDCDKLRAEAAARLEREALEREQTRVFSVTLGDPADDIGRLTIYTYALARRLMAMYGLGVPDSELPRSDANRLVETPLGNLEHDLNAWIGPRLLFDPGIHRLTREEFLARLESWPVQYALELLGVPAVHRHIDRIRAGTRDQDRRDRKRLKAAFARLAAPPEPRGPERKSPPSNAADIGKAYRATLAAVHDVRAYDFSEHAIETGEASDAIDHLLGIAMVPGRLVSRPRLIQLCRAGGSSARIAEHLVSQRFGVSARDVQRSLKAERTRG